MTPQQNLPEGWTVAFLEDIAFVRLGKTPRRKDYRDNGIHRIIKFRDITPNGIDYSINKAGYVDDTPEALKGLRPLFEGDVLLTASAHSGESIGKKCAYVDKLIEMKGNVYFVGELLGIKSDKRVMNSKWPYLWFLSEAGFKSVQKAVAGVHLTNGRAKRIMIPLPPLPEQMRIVEKVEVLLKRVNTARDRLSKIPNILKRFRQSVLAAACLGELTEDWRNEPNIKSTINSEDTIDHNDPDLPQIPDNWIWTVFENIAEQGRSSLKAGPFGSALKKEFYTPTGYKIYGQEQVIKGDPFYGDYYIGEERYRSLESCKVKPEDILISLVGTIGKVLVLPERIEPGIINPRLVKISLDKLKANPIYIKFLLESELIRNIFERVSHGGTMQILNLKIIKTIPIPLPPLHEQQEITRRIDELFNFTNTIEQQLTSVKKYVNKLTQSILAKAFRGELVSTEAELAHREGREYEPANVLLERIKSERNETCVTGSDDG